MNFAYVPFATIPFSDTIEYSRVYFDAEFSISASYELLLYVSTNEGFATRPTDTLRSQPFRGVMQSYNFTRSIVGSEIGVWVPGIGSLVISNADAFYDFLPRDYTIDATEISVKLTTRDTSYDDAYLVAKVTAMDWDIDLDNIVIELRDPGYKLDTALQTNVYLGTGGKEGGADLANKTKPLAFGTPHEVQPPLLNTLLIYQVNDGPIQGITAVYDRGVTLAFIADYPDYASLAAADLSAEDGYATCLAEGLFRLADLPEFVTCDVQGDNRDGYITTSADIVRWAIRNRTQIVDPDGIDTGTFDVVNAARPAPIEYWVGVDQTISVADFITNIMGGILGWGGHRRDGIFELRLFEAPTGDAVMSFTRADVVGDDIVRLPLPSAYRPPPWRWHVTYARAYTVQTDLTTDVTAARKAFLAEPYRLGGAEDEAVKFDHPFATDPEPIQAYFADKTDADDEGQRRIDLFKTTRALYRFSVDRRGLLLSLGDVIELTHERFDLSLGRKMVVLSLIENISFDDKIEIVEIQAYG